MGTDMQSTVAHWRSTYAEERERLAERFRTDGDADRYLHGHAAVLDEILEDLSRPYLEATRSCLLATAGYARREQFPYSDVDLVLVHTLEEPQEVESRFGPLLRALWDVRLVLGHQVVHVGELERLGLEDFEFILALFNLRPIAGDRELARHVAEEILPALIHRRRERLREIILEEVSRRHRRFDDTIFQLEPDVKEAPGALRDVLAMQWLDRLRETPEYLPYSQAQVATAHQFLKRLRIHVHLEHGRGDNRLTHELQERLASRLGFVGSDTQAAVESLMKEYFWNARVIGACCQAYLDALRPRPVQATLPAEEVPKIEQIGDILDLYRLALRQGKTLSPVLRKAVQAALPRISETIRYPSLAADLLELLRPKPGLFWVLNELYELGVLELLFPEFGTIRARMIRDFYHRYTVDEHTLIAVRNIEALLREEEGSDQRFASVLRDTVRPELLTLALLLHDVGKARTGKHANESARLAARALRRFRFGREEIDTVVFLVRHHLEMSNIIFRRDLEDEEVISKFADLVRDPERLRLLTLLTYADISAVAPGTLNEWKRDLLWQLYVQTYRRLTLGYGKKRIEEEDIGVRLIRNLSKDLDPFDFEQFLEGFPQRYLRSFSPAAVYRHYRLSLRLGRDNPVEAVIRRRGNFYELVVITPDQRRLFARIVGLLSYFEMNILRATGFANKRQTILDVFHFEDEQGFFRHRSEKQRFLQLLRQAVGGELSVRKLLEGKERSVLFRRRTPWFEPTIYFEDDEQGRYTILEIIAPDALGLLYRISNEISRLECDIELALISTEGDKAVDVFYLQHRGGRLSPELQRRLADAIRGALSQQ
ncbi:MAG: [protein-PII] uridylyltransferase [Acidobacteriota bacterium]